MATEIPASSPVVVPAITYDKWFLTSLSSTIQPDNATLNVQLTRSGMVDKKVVLMPRINTRQTPPNRVTFDPAVVNFSIDLWKEAETTPEIASAIDGVLKAVLAYANENKLI